MSQAAASGELTLRRSPEDYAAYQKQVSGEMTVRSRAYRFIYWGSAALAGMIALALVFLVTGGGAHSLDLPQFAVLLLAFFGAWSLLNWLAAPLLRVRLYPRLDIFCSPVRLSMTDTSLHMDGRGYSNSFEWSVITGVVETEAHIFVRVDGISTVVVPRRDFADAAQIALFLQAVRAQIAAARPA